jgi:hypothetical protein
MTSPTSTALAVATAFPGLQFTRCTPNGSVAQLVFDGAGGVGCRTGNGPRVKAVWIRVKAVWIRTGDSRSGCRCRVQVVGRSVVLSLLR